MMTVISGCLQKNLKSKHQHWFSDGISSVILIDCVIEITLTISEKMCYIIDMKKEDTAILSSFDKYTTFSFNGKKLTFRTCNNLERYTKIILWDNGYIEVMAKYKHKKDEQDELN